MGTLLDRVQLNVWPAELPAIEWLGGPEVEEGATRSLLRAIFGGEPGRIRTSDTQIKSLLFYR